MGNTQLAQDRIDELVEVFYIRLVKDNYYSRMFTERNVNIEELKERQKLFIKRLANEESIHHESGEVDQVKKRHTFQTTPERAEVWLSHMEIAMNEIKLEESIKKNLLEKMTFLMGSLIK